MGGWLLNVSLRHGWHFVPQTTTTVDRVHKGEQNKWADILHSKWHVTNSPIPPIYALHLSVFYEITKTDFIWVTVQCIF